MSAGVGGIERVATHSEKVKPERILSGSVEAPIEKVISSTEEGPDGE
jgi:hypothetical protein